MISELIKHIADVSGVSEDEIRSRISAKQEELLGLISPEGAAYLIANEFGVNLKTQERLRIQNLIPGMQSVDIVGRILAINKKEFETEKSKGKIASVLIGDETGAIRLVLWNDAIAKISGFKKNDVVKLRASVHEGLYGPELRIRGGITPSDEEIGLQIRQSSRAYIRDLRQGDFRDVRVCIVQIFESVSFYEVCSQCGARLKDRDNANVCEEHGNVEHKYSLVVSGIIDDGSENMRAVFFGENAEHIIGMSTEDARNVFMKKMDKAAIFEKVVLGKETILKGNVRRNKLFDRLEFIVSDVKDVDIKKEIELIMKEPVQ